MFLLQEHPSLQRGHCAVQRNIQIDIILKSAFSQMSFDSPTPSLRSIRSIRIQHRMSVLQVIFNLYPHIPRCFYRIFFTILSHYQWHQSAFILIFTQNVLYHIETRSRQQIHFQKSDRPPLPIEPGRQIWVLRENVNKCFVWCAVLSINWKHKQSWCYWTNEHGILTAVHFSCGGTTWRFGNSDSQ